MEGDHDNRGLPKGTAEGRIDDYINVAVQAGA
jgi:hypothetical protein